MADQQPQQQQQARMTAPWPSPPPFYTHFTKQKISLLRQIRKEASTTTNNDILSLPPDLRYLIPPPPPPSGTYHTFGRSLSTTAPTPSLTDLNITQLYPTHPSVASNPQTHLIALARSQLATFLSLVGTLSQDAEKWEESTKELETVTANMLGLVNQYRPHQARETLVGLMEERVERMRAEVGRVREVGAKVRDTLSGLGEEAEVGAGQVDESDERGVRHDIDGKGKVEDKRKVRQRAAWAALEVMEGSG